MAIQTDYMVLADAATAADGKLYIHGGGWNRINVASFPVVYSFALGIQFRIPWTDTNVPCTIEFDVVDEDERSIFPDEAKKIKGEITAGRPPDLIPGDDQVLSMGIRINPEFQHAGQYKAIMRLDGVPAQSAKFRVIAVPPIQVSQQ